MTVERELRTPDRSSEGILLAPLGDDRYRLEFTSFVTDAVYGDVIRATETQRILKEVSQLGGEWEQYFGRMLVGPYAPGERR